MSAATNSSKDGNVDEDTGESIRSNGSMRLRNRPRSANCVGSTAGLNEADQHLVLQLQRTKERKVKDSKKLQSQPQSSSSSSSHSGSTSRVVATNIERDTSTSKSFRDLRSSESIVEESEDTRWETANKPNLNSRRNVRNFNQQGTINSMKGKVPSSCVDIPSRDTGGTRSELNISSMEPDPVTSSCAPRTKDKSTRCIPTAKMPSNERTFTTCLTLPGSMSQPVVSLTKPLSTNNRATPYSQPNPFSYSNSNPSSSLYSSSDSPNVVQALRNQDRPGPSSAKTTTQKTQRDKACKSSDATNSRLSENLLNTPSDSAFMGVVSPNTNQQSFSTVAAATTPVSKRTYRRLKCSSNPTSAQKPPFVSLVDSMETYTYSGIQGQTMDLRPCIFVDGRPLEIKQCIRVHFDHDNHPQYDKQFYLEKQVDVIHYKKYQYLERFVPYFEYIGHGLYVPKKIKGFVQDKAKRRRLEDVNDTGEHRMDDSTARDMLDEPYLYASQGFRELPPGKHHVVYVLVICKLCRKSDLTGGKQSLQWFSHDNASKVTNHVFKYHPAYQLEIQAHPGRIVHRFVDSVKASAQYSKFIKRLFDVAVSTNQAIRWIEQPSVKLLIREIYKQEVGVPSTAALLEHLDKQVSITIPLQREKLKEDIACGTIMIDTWLSKRRKTIMAVNLAYTDKNFHFYQLCLKVAVLDCSLEEGTTGRKLVEVIKDVVKETGLNDKIIYCISDSGSNAVAALKLYEQWKQVDDETELDNYELSRAQETLQSNSALENDELPTIVESTESDSASLEIEADLSQTAIPITIDYQPTPENPPFAVSMHTQHRCMAHVLQLCIVPAVCHRKEAPAGVRGLFHYIRKLTVYVRRRDYLTGQLEKACGKGLRQPNKTRWNSFIDSLGRLVDPVLFRHLMRLMEKENQKPHHRLRKKPPRPPTSKDFERLQQLFRVLNPISVATDNLQIDGVTSHILLYEITLAYLHVKGVTDLDEDVKISQQILIDGILSRFRPVFKSKAIIAATLFNPRTKRLFEWIHSVMEENPFDCPTQEQAVSIVTTLIPSFVLDTEFETSVTSGPRRKKHNTFVPMAGSGNGSHGKTVFHNYLDEPIIDSPPDFPEYWRSKSSVWPTLSCFVKLFAFPVTTGNIERLFSRLRLINRDQRSNLDTETMNKLIQYQQFCLEEDLVTELEKQKEKRILKRITAGDEDSSDDYMGAHIGELHGDTGSVYYQPYIKLDSSDEEILHSGDEENNLLGFYMPENQYSQDIIHSLPANFNTNNNASDWEIVQRISHQENESQDYYAENVENVPPIYNEGLQRIEESITEENDFIMRIGVGIATTTRTVSSPENTSSPRDDGETTK